MRERRAASEVGFTRRRRSATTLMAVRCGPRDCLSSRILGVEEVGGPPRTQPAPRRVASNADIKRDLV